MEHDPLDFEGVTVVCKKGHRETFTNGGPFAVHFDLPLPDGRTKVLACRVCVADFFGGMSVEVVAPKGASS